MVRFVNRAMKGSMSDEIAKVFFGARLVALTKKCGGTRPIAVGLTLRGLAL